MTNRKSGKEPIAKARTKNAIRRGLALFLVFIIAAVFASCEKTPIGRGEEPSPSKLIVTDLIGRDVTVEPGTYKRVVCIGAGALRMYSYIGDVSLLSGVEDIENSTLSERPKMFDGVARPYVLAYKDVFEALPSCGTGGPNAQTAEAERILACAPDIVISEYEDVEKEDALQAQLGVPVITLRSGPNGVFAEEFRDSILLLGKIFQKENEAEKLLYFVESERMEIQKRTAAIPEEEKPGVYICGLGNWGTTNHLYTAQNYAPFVVANVKSVVNGLEKDGISPIEEEKFVAMGDAIDVMIIDSAAVKNMKPILLEDPTLLDSAKAWRTGDVYLEMAYNAYYTNYEIALANTWFLAKTIYPARFSDIDIDEKLDEITDAFLGTPLREAIYAHPQNFGGYQKIDTETFFQ